MLSCPSCAGKALPKELRKTAEALFPAECGAPGSKPDTELWQPAREAILDFAEKLGVGTDYLKLYSGWKNADELENFLQSFGNNLDLLIQKTWVEKADEDRKEKLLNRIPGFIALIKEGDLSRALKEFGSILEELAWLFFGAQSREKDFFDYVFRIDHQFGLFWWYGGQLEQFLTRGSKDDESLRTILLLGLCYLTDF